MQRNSRVIALWLTCSYVLVGMISCAPGEPNFRCCYDQEYSVILGQVGAGMDITTGQAYIDDGFVRLSKDYYRNRYGTRVTMKQPDGSFASTYQLRDYGRRLVYTMKDNATCTYTDMPSHEKMHESCIPEMATFVRSATLGYGSHTLRTNTWQFPFPVTANDTAHFTLTVTRDHCVPVMETMVANVNGKAIEETLLFVKYHPGIVDINFLIPPSNCQRVSPSDLPPFLGHGFLGAI